jgi:biotin carboxyl carrier protein
MSSGSPSPELDLPPTEAWQEVEAALDELVRLARSDVKQAELHGKLLERLVGLLAAVGGAVWIVSDAQQAAIECQLQLDHSLAGDHQEFRRHQRLAEAVAAAGQPRLIPPAYRDAELANASPWLAILCPIALEGRPIAVVEIFQRPGGRAAAEEGYLRLVRTACDVAEEYHRTRALSTLRQEHDELKLLADYQQRVHQHLDLPLAAAVIVNESRRVLGCDRVTLLIRRGKRAHVAAISGVSSFDRRSGVVLGLEKIATLVLPTGEPLWFPAQADELPPQLAELIETHLDESHAQSLGLLPLADESRQESPPQGLLCVERFTATVDQAFQQRASSLARASVPAVAHALEFDRIPLRGAVQRTAGFFGFGSDSRTSPALISIAIVLAAALALWLIPAELTIEARGQLMPKRRQHVFAPSDGVVVELLHGDGDAVEAQQPLAKLHSPALDIQHSELVGKQRTVHEDLVAAETAALRSELENNSSQPRGQATARVEQLKAELRGLEAQLAIVRTEQAALDVKSPLAGTVITWDAERQLAGRPVKRGDTLLTVADLSGAWELVLDVPDRSAGHVLLAHARQPQLPATFQLGTDPGNVRQAMVTSVSPATQLSAENQPAVRVTADLDDQATSSFRPGATVIARLHCGRRSLGYVWLHELFESLRLRLFL